MPFSWYLFLSVTYPSRFIRDAKIISAAMTVVPSAGVPRLSLIKESPFLPSLLSGTDL